MKKLQNCRDFMKCGFGPDGSKTHNIGPCQAAREHRLMVCIAAFSAAGRLGLLVY
ncbi:MAG: hypothetical protein JRE18_00845 [Deltaproteobacteria bacterium]|nr:hypothetical protein [Deltaproteobacteria bacterium]